MMRWRARKEFKRPSLYAGIIAGVLAACLALVGIDAWRTWQARDVVLADDKDETANLARSLAQHAHDLVQTTDVVLLGLQDRIAADGLKPDALARLQAVMTKQASALPAIKRLAVLDRDGNDLAGSSSSARSPDTAATANFQYHHDHRTSSPYVGEPWKSRSDGDWVFSISRRIETDDGHFAGVVVAAVSTDFIDAFYSSFTVRQKGIVSLVTSTGRLVARSPFREGMTGADLSSGQIFKDFLPYSPTGSFRFRSALEGSEVLGSYSQVHSYPLVVVVAHGYGEVLADWWWEACRHLAVTGTIAVVMVFAGFRFAGQIRSRQRAERHYRLLADNSIDAIVSIGLDGRWLYLSPAFEAMTGRSMAESSAHEWAHFAHPHDHNSLQLLIRKFRDGAANLTAEYRYFCKDGKCIWVEARCNLVPASVGEDAQIVANIRDITDRKKFDLRLAALNQRLAAQANTDQLTNLANRRRFDEVLEQERQRSAREQTPLSLLLLDVDRFKLYNDRYGHPAGDRCLAAVAAALRACGRRPGDLVARYGGEEFAILLPGTPMEGALQRAEAIRAAVQALGHEHDGNAPANVVTASLGVATCYPGGEGRPLTADAIIAMADEGLYAAKRTGRNRVVHHADIPQTPASPTPPLLSDEQRRLETLAHYEAAVADGNRDTLDRLARLTAALFQVPIALVSLVGQDSQCFIGRSGLDTDGTPRTVSFCAHALGNTDVLTVLDTQKDRRFAQNPLVTGEPHIRFYAGAPLLATDGARLGALCIIDHVPRAMFTTAQKALLANLAALAVDHLRERSSQAQA